MCHHWGCTLIYLPLFYPWMQTAISCLLPGKQSLKIMLKIYFNNKHIPHFIFFLDIFQDTFKLTILLNIVSLGLPLSEIQCSALRLEPDSSKTSIRRLPLIYAVSEWNRYLITNVFKGIVAWSAFKNLIAN